MKKSILLFMVVMFCMLFASSMAAQTLEEPEARILVEIKNYINGQQSIRYFRIDPATGDTVPLEMAASSQDADAMQTAVLDKSLHWKGKKINFNNTKLAKTHKAKIAKFIKKYINARRGNKNVPKMKILTKVVTIKPMSQFRNPAEFYIQKDWDKNNTVIMTEDDQFFESINGILLDPRVISITKIFASAQLKLQGNRFVGTYWLNEADVYLRSDFFKRALMAYTRAGTVAFRLAYGYISNIWTHCILGDNNSIYVTDGVFNNKNSFAWKIMYEQDDFFYQELPSSGPDLGYLDKPRMLPFEDEVLDLKDYTVPYFEFDELRLGKTPELFLTTLKGYDGKKKMIIKISRVTNTNPVKKISVLSLSGNMLRYPKSVPGYSQKFYPTIFLTHVRLGKEADLNKLKNAVKTHGIPKKIGGVQFDKALKIFVKITGYLEENGRKKNISRYLWLVDTTI